MRTSRRRRHVRDPVVEVSLSYTAHSARLVSTGQYSRSIRDVNCCQLYGHLLGYNQSVRPCNTIFCLCNIFILPPAYLTEQPTRMDIWLVCNNSFIIIIILAHRFAVCANTVGFVDDCSYMSENTQAI